MKRPKPKKKTISLAAKYSKEKGNIKKTPPSSSMVSIVGSPNWFGNVRTMPQHELQRLQTKYAKTMADPYKMIITSRRLPLSLLELPKQSSCVKARSDFKHPIAEKSSRKPAIAMGVSSPEEFLSLWKKTSGGESGQTAKRPNFAELDSVTAFTKVGRSDRIRGEVLKLIDSSDVLLHVLDARDPEGTRLLSYEALLKKEFPHKKSVFLLNKIDLVPPAVAAQWLGRLGKEAPTLAFSSSHLRYNFTKDFGVAAAFKLFSQFKSLFALRGRTWLAIGVLGYPNVGKSSFINAMKGKRVCPAAPVPGETKVGQYVNLFSDVYLIDAPGVVAPAVADNKTDLVLRGVCRIETLTDPGAHVSAVLRRVDPDFLRNYYGLAAEWSDTEDFLTQLAVKRGKLKKGGLPETNKVACCVLQDWVRGRLPWFNRPKEADRVQKAGLRPTHAAD